MPKLELSVPVTIDAPPGKVFDYFADHRHVAQVLRGVSKWEPIGEQTQGTGVRYSVEMLALGFPLRSVLRLDRWHRPHEIGWVSESGLIKQRGGFTFTPAPDGATHVVLRIEYTPPASLLGAAVAGRLDGFVGRRLRTAMERIRETLE